MGGADLKEGNYKNGNISEKEINEIIDKIMALNISLSSSYKFAMVDSILTCIGSFNSDYSISYYKLFAVFSEKYWWLIVNNGLRQSSKTKSGRILGIEKVFNDICLKNNLNKFVLFTALDEETIDEIVRKVKKECSRYVFGALFEDTRELFYSFSNKDEVLQLNPQVFKHFYINQDIILRRNEYAWGELLTKFNENIAIPDIANIFQKYNSIESGKDEVLIITQEKNYGEFKYKQNAPDDDIHEKLNNPEKLIKELKERHNT